MTIKPVRWSEAGYLGEGFGEALAGCFLAFCCLTLALGAVIVMLLVGVVWWKAFMWPAIGLLLGVLLIPWFRGD